MRRRPADVAGALAGFGLAALVLAPSLLGRTAFLPADLWMRAIPWAFAPPAEAARFPSNPLLADPAILYAPQLHVARESLRQGSLPLWNPHFRCGEPLLATAVSGPLAPTQWPVLLLPWPDGFAWSAWLRLGLVWAGAYLLGRRLRLGRGLALGLALSFALLPAVWLHLQQPHATVAVWLPWWLLAVERLGERAREGPRAALRAALPLAGLELLVLSATHAQAAFNFGFAGALHLLLRLPLRPWRAAVAARAAGLAALALGAGLGAPLWLPVAELLRDSATWVERSAMGREWLPSPRALRLFFDPFALGSWTSGPAWRGRLNFEEEQQYLGLLPWVFLVGGAGLLARAARREAALVAALLGTLAVCGSLAFGWPPLHGWLASLPPLDVNRNARFRLFVEAALLLLAALAARDWRGALAGRGAPPAAPYALAALAAGGALALVAVGPGARFAGRPWLALGAACALWLAGALAATPGARRLAGALVPLLLLADLGPVYAGYHPQPPRGWADPARGAAELPAALRDASPAPRVAAQDFAPPNLPALLGAVDVAAYSLPVAARTDLFQRRVLGLADPDRLTRADLAKPDVLRALAGSCAEWLYTNVDYGPEAADQVELVDERRGIRLYRLKRAAPFAGWHPAAEVARVRDREAALAHLLAARGRFPEPVAVEGEPDAAAPAAQAPSGGTAAAARQVTPQRIEVELPGAAETGAGVLLVRTSFDPGWRAESETGRALRVLPAQLRFVGVEAPAGTRRVVLRYAPPHAAGALAAAGAALALGVAAFAWSRRGAR